MKQKESPETSLWISTTDLMSGLLVVFLFVAVLMNEDIQALTEERSGTYQKLDEMLDEKFTPAERAAYNLQSNGTGNIGHASFSNTEVNFAQGSERITPEFAKVLDNFLPKYISAIRACDADNIKEIRIEGHTSSEWEWYVTPDQAYINNMRLSQNRTREIIKYALAMDCFTNEDKDFIKDKLTANGLSSSHLIYKEDGTEDAEASRRIEFRVVTNDDKYMHEIEERMGNGK